MLVTLTGDGINPGVSEAVARTDASGKARVTIQGVANRAKLVTLAATAFTSVDTITDILYVDFPEPVGGELLTQNADNAVDEPVSIDDYFSSLPKAMTLEEVEALRRSSRLIVAGERPKRRATARTPNPCTRSKAISSHSANDR